MDEQRLHRHLSHSSNRKNKARKGDIRAAHLHRRGPGRGPGAAGAGGQAGRHLDPRATPNVSLIDLTFNAKNKTSVEEINGAIVAAAKGKLKGILTTNSAPLVSSDFNHNPASSTSDLSETQVIDGKFVRVMAWYDNEWGFSNRMSDTAVAMGKLL